MFEFDLQDKAIYIKIKTSRFDATVTEKFLTTLDEYCAESLESAKIDLKGVEFIDSSGIGALLKVHRSLNSPSRTVKLLNPSPSVMSIIKILRLERAFELNLETKPT